MNNQWEKTPLDVLVYTFRYKDEMRIIYVSGNLVQIYKLAPKNAKEYVVVKPDFTLDVKRLIVIRLMEI